MVPPPALGPTKQRRSSGVLEDFTNAFASLGGALEIVFGADLLRNCHTLPMEFVTLR